MDVVGGGEGPDLLPDVLAEGVLERVVRSARPERDEHRHRLPLDLVRAPDRRRLGDGGMADQGAFHFGGAQPVSRDLDDIVGPAHEPHIAVRVFMAYVARGVAIGDRVPVGLIPLRIFVDGAHHGRPGFLDDQYAAFAPAHRLAGFVNNIRDYAGQRKRG